jgi:small subunit ribosomal protein S35
LTELAKPFELPKESEKLRFRYTTYFGEQHPADKKVVVEWSPFDIPELTEIQRMKLIKLAGVRYNPTTRLVKMSSESFETQAQNKRHLGDLVNKLLTEARDPKDTFEDVPADFRHHKPKPFHKLPERWKLTPERRKVLEEKRRQVLEAEQEQRASGKLVDGKSQIEESMKRLGMAQLQERRRAAEAAGQKVPIGRAAPVRGRVGQPPGGGRPRF